MTGDLLTIIGLSADIVGVLILFKYGFPQPSYDEVSVTALEASDNTVLADGTSIAQLKADLAKRKKLYRTMSFTGLFVVLLGFVLQLLGVIVGN